MDATLKNFLNEINEIAPPENKPKDCPWQECFDESTGFPYYWNVETNAVTWEIPDEFKEYLERSKKASKGPEVTTVPLFPSAIAGDEDSQDTKLKKTKRKIEDEKNGKSSKARRRSSSESEDEKIVLISSYGGDTESENDEKEEKELKDEKVQVKVTENLKSIEEVSVEVIKKPVTGFSLLAAYADSENDDEEEEITELEEKTSHSTLFPIVKPIDVNQFTEPKPNEYLEAAADVDLEKKAFQRKRRIGVSLVNRKYVKEEDERKGLGFGSESEKKTEELSVKSAKYGIAFVKSETLNGDGEKAEEKEMEEAQKELREKLGFLSEGKDVVSPVQIMQIQLETLYAAYVDGSLNSSYLNRWLKETCEGLIKLEEAATPSGWLLQWDRVEKRYYYRNKLTDESQWNYPQIEDDAMDICTTPPPPTELEEGEILNSPSPQPQPPPATPPRTPPIIQNDLIVPSCEITATAVQSVPLVEESQSSNVPADLNSVLNSFYTDIAALESSQQVNTAGAKVAVIEEQTGQSFENLPNKEAKKKKKVKVASLKKKNVSKLVEKWNNVQKDLN